MRHVTVYTTEPKWCLTPFPPNAHIAEIVIKKSKLRNAIDENVADWEGDVA